MKPIIKQLDNFQFSHRPIGLVVAVLLHYSRDGAGRQAALITYYMFLSLFPLLVLLSLLAHVFNKYDPALVSSLIHGATNYFPVLGRQLNKITNSSSNSLSGMLVAGFVALYGARGVATVFGQAVNDIWGIPENSRYHSTAKWLRSLAVVVIGGLGFVVTASITSWALGQGHGNLFRLLTFLLSIVLLTFVFVAILKISLPKSVTIKRLFNGAVFMACALALLQLIGGFIVTHDLKHYSDTYTTLFGAALGLIAWIYIVTKILIYAIELSAVIDRKSWPVHWLED